jgi:hypothetical protein
MITYISIGNSDDKLSQSRWAGYFGQVAIIIHRAASVANGAVRGQWVSETASAWQNACWCVELNADSAEHLKMRLADVASDYGQESIAWAEAPVTEFLKSGA